MLSQTRRAVSPLLHHFSRNLMLSAWTAMTRNLRRRSISLIPPQVVELHSKDAAGVIYKFVAAHSEKRSSKPLFEHSAINDSLFQCSVILPKNAPLANVTGPPAKSKNEARRLACYHTCQRLYQLGYLDHTLFPRPPTIRSFLPDIYAGFNVEPGSSRKRSRSP